MEMRWYVKLHPELGLGTSVWGRGVSCFPWGVCAHQEALIRGCCCFWAPLLCQSPPHWRCRVLLSATLMSLTCTHLGQAGLAPGAELRLCGPPHRSGHGGYDQRRRLRDRPGGSGRCYGQRPGLLPHRRHLHRHLHHGVPPPSQAGVLQVRAPACRGHPTSTGREGLLLSMPSGVAGGGLVGCLLCRSLPCHPPASHPTRSGSGTVPPPATLPHLTETTD